MMKESRYGGTPTLMNTLEVGTKFHVCNGNWDGEIVEIDGEKYVKIDEDRMYKAENRYSEINIIN
ncbi:hypothetical protein [Priestia megaterium]|uniref:hypothetical protein n=1 Tax=Priestia megaterium TaxID=1404 RepID=UPI002877FAAB|nr:hypothetical protein [Priestia megaterium]